MCAGDGGAVGLIPPSEKTGLHLAGANRMGPGLGRKFAPARCRGHVETTKSAGKNKKIPQACAHYARKCVFCKTGRKAERRKRILAEKKKDWRKTTAFSELKRDLESSLQARGLVEQVYRDKVNEYLDFWVLHQELKADIKARGLVVMDDRGRESENRSVSLSIQVSRQMLNIYTALGFKSDAPRGGDPDDEL